MEYQRPAVQSLPVRLPLRPSFLAGRDELLSDLHGYLSAGSSLRPRVAALCGLGGSGKTSAAIEYAHRHLDKFGLVWQLEAGEPATLAAGFVDLAAQLGVRDALDVGNPVAQVHAVLAARQDDWLLIFDNAPSMAAIRQLLPPAGRGQVLVTSQDPHWPGFYTLDVLALDRQTAAAFMLDRIGSADVSVAMHLAGELGGLPLALEQAAAYILATGRSISEYLTLLQTRRHELLARGEPTGYDKQVASTWVLAFEQLRCTVPAAVSLLRLLSFCAPERIPIELLMRSRPHLAENLPTELIPLLNDPLARDEAVAALRHFSLISAPQDGMVSMHRLVQEVTINQLSYDQATKWRQSAEAVIQAALPENPGFPQDWPAYAALLPHVEAALPTDSLGTELAASYLAERGNYAAARDLSREIVAACEQSLGNEHPSVVAARERLAYRTGTAGDPVGARVQYESLLMLAERILGAEHPDTISIRGNLAHWTGFAGDPAGARDEIAALLPIVDRILGPEHPAALSARAVFAHWTGRAGDPAMARDLYTMQVPIRERVLGPEHPMTLGSRAELAEWCGEAGDPVAARDQYAAVASVQEAILGGDHPLTLGSRLEAARWTGAAGDAEAAKNQLETLLPVIERVCGPEDSRVLGTRLNLARCIGRTGDPVAARDQYAALLPIVERVSGPEHRNTLGVRSNLARWTGLAGDPVAARDQYAALLPIVERVLGPEHRDTLIVRRNHARWVVRVKE